MNFLNLQRTAAKFPACASTAWPFCLFVKIDADVIFAAAVFKAAGDTLSRPLPHVYQADQQGNAVPFVPPEEIRQDAVNSMGTAGMHSAVRVQDLASISQKHVRPLCLVSLPNVTQHSQVSQQNAADVAGMMQRLPWLSRERWTQS